MTTRPVLIADDEVADELKAIAADTRALFERIVALIRTFGLEAVREPHVKHLEGKLWEMPLKGRNGIARAIYMTAIGRRIVVLRVFTKKTEKTPRREIELATKRATELS